MVVTGGNVNTTNSKVHHIGENPFDGTQHGRAILYINGATGTISGNKVYDFQKNGIEVRGVTADASAPSSTKTSATIVNNVITGQGAIDYIAQNGIVILEQRERHRQGQHGSATFFYTGPMDTEATGILNYDVAGSRIERVGQHVRQHRDEHRRPGRGDPERPRSQCHDPPPAGTAHRLQERGAADEHRHGQAAPLGRQG